MPLKNIPLTKNDFEEVLLEDVIKNCGKKECHNFAQLFFNKAEEAREAGKEKSEEAFSLLGNITSMRLKPDSPTAPFIPMFAMTNSRTAIMDDFYDEHLNVLDEIVSDISDPEIRARIADVLWIKKRDHSMAKLAIKSYLESATILEDPEHWTPCAERIERAFRLGASLGKNAGYLDSVISHIETLLAKQNGQDPKYLSNRMMDFLLEQRLGDFKKYSALSEKMAKRAESDDDWYRARTYWETQARWYSLDKDEIGKKTALIHAAETYVKDAEAALKRKIPSYMVATAHLQHAIEAYRRIGGEEKRIDELHGILLEYQKESTNELKPISTEINLTETVKKAIARVKDKTLHEAIFELVLILDPPQPSDLRKEVQDLAEKSPLRHLFRTSRINEKGKVTGHMPSLFSNNPEEVEEAIRANMFEQAEQYHSRNAQGIIEPIRHQINLEHNVKLSDFLPIVLNNPLIPEGHEYIYARGLLAGMEGDFLLAGHLLIPQFENSLRHVLTQHGIITSGIDSKGIQDEHSLNKTLYLPEINEIFGEDITFDLQGLLVERFGVNLRNRMAHGLMQHDAFYSLDMSYLWWLILRLCCLPIIVQINKSKGQQKTDSEIDDEVKENGQSTKVE